jgi:hypothetical protein
LEDIALTVPHDGALVGLLAQLPGAAVRIQTGAMSLEGVVIGVQDLQVASGAPGGASVLRPHLTLLTSGSIRYVKDGFCASLIDGIFVCFFLQDRGHSVLRWD